VERSEAEAVYSAGCDAVVGVFLALSAQNERLESQVGKLTARVARQDERIATLERQLGRSSRNSSQPPSQDPPGAPPRSKGRSGRAQGAQPGHKGSGRKLLPIAQVDDVVPHWPSSCSCGHVFSVSDRVPVGDPVRHQVQELPQVAAVVIEHQCLWVRCPDCGGTPRGGLPPEVAGSAFGPRLQAAVVTLSVRNRVSRRDVVELVEQLFHARISTGTVDAILERAADALTDPYEDLLDQIRGAEALNMDETGWRLKGKTRTLWGAFTDRHAALRVTGNRHEDHARELLGNSTAVVTSDRWWAYNHLPLKRRQICWSHLRRDFQAQAEGLGAEKELGDIGLAVCEQLFTAWRTYQQTGDRGELNAEILTVRRQLKPVLRKYSGKAPRYKRTRGLARNLLKVWPALWTFTKIDGVTPTNNHAERGLRGAVIHRKLSLGSQSENGETRIARLLSAHTTCRLQNRSLHDYLTAVFTATARGDPTPLLA
jgi:transposase